MKIGVVIDHPKRDLAGLTRTAAELTRRGVSAYLIPLYQQAVDVPLLALDAIVLSHARPANLDLIRAYRRMGIAVFVLDSEGGVLSETGANAPTRSASFVRDSGASTWLAGYMFWGERQHVAFREGAGMPPDALAVTGCPRFDLCHPGLRSQLAFPHRDYVLINTSFPLVNPLFSGSSDRERETLIAAGWEAAYVDLLLADLRTTFGRFVEEVERLAAADRRVRLLIRPHPFERPAVYEAIARRHANVTVDGRGDVLNAIANARFVIHVNCGTAIEATMLERLPMSLTYLVTERVARHSRLPFEVSHRAASFEDVRYALRHLEELTRAHDFAGVYARHIRPWFFELDGRAASRVAEFIIERARASGSRVPQIWLRRSLRGSRDRSTGLQVVQAVVANLVGSRASAALRAVASPARRQKQVTSEHVRGELHRSSQTDDTMTPRVAHARHPITRLPLASLRLDPARRAAGEGGPPPGRPR